MFEFIKLSINSNYNGRRPQDYLYTQSPEASRQQPVADPLPDPGHIPIAIGEEIEHDFMIRTELRIGHTRRRDCVGAIPSLEHIVVIDDMSARLPDVIYVKDMVVR